MDKILLPGHYLNPSGFGCLKLELTTACKIMEFLDDTIKTYRAKFSWFLACSEGRGTITLNGTTHLFISNEAIRKQEQRLALEHLDILIRYEIIRLKMKYCGEVELR